MGRTGAEVGLGGTLTAVGVTTSVPEMAVGAVVLMGLELWFEFRLKNEQPDRTKRMDKNNNIFLVVFKSTSSGNIK
jgi:hypothetical protein